MRHKTLKAILFDLDGVLVNSSPIHHRAFLKTLRGLGITRIDYSRIAGMSTDQSIRLLLRKAGKRLSEREIAHLVAHKQALSHQQLSRRLPLMPGCRSVLARLARQFRLALVSSSSRKSVNHFLKTSGTGRRFAAVVSGDDVVHAKPSPESYRLGLQRLGARAREALVVEDAVSGVTAARLLKIRTLGLSGTCPSGALRKAGAEKVVGRLAAVIPYAERL